jgi:carboxypeptidase Taq
LQRTLAVRLMAASGLDMQRARLDESHHPFCGGVPRDVRITNRYRPEEFLSGLMGVLHEAGHGKYEQGLPGDFADQPVGKARGMVVHESQSLLQEMQVSRGSAFMLFLTAQIRATFPDHVSAEPDAFTPENLHRLQTQVKRSLIRVNADEVTYPGHVMVRYDLERALIAGKLEVSDLPEAWTEKMLHYLGIPTLGNDKDGCLQDVHWPSGAFGYFPLYTLGAIVSAQLFKAARAAHDGLYADLARGDLSRLNQWLLDNIWSKGSSESVTELLVSATGRPLDPSFFIQHLKSRYSGL